MIAAAMAADLCEHGDEVRTGAPVARVLVKEGRAAGVELAGGERILADLSCRATNGWSARAPPSPAVAA